MKVTIYFMQKTKIDYINTIKSWTSWNKEYPNLKEFWKAMLNALDNYKRRKKMSNASYRVGNQGQYVMYYKNKKWKIKKYKKRGKKR